VVVEEVVVMKPPQDPEITELMLAAVLAVGDKSHPVHRDEWWWRQMCQFFLDHPDQPVPVVLDRELKRRYLLKPAPKKKITGPTIADWVDWFLKTGRFNTPTEARRAFAEYRGLTEDAVDKAHRRARRVKGAAPGPDKNAKSVPGQKS
jgi:hypothetical protein